jgi:hypothetical protein
MVRIAPCDMRGSVLGDEINARASFVPPEEYPAVRRLFLKKYGVQFRLFFGMNTYRQKDSALFLVISPDASEGTHPY